MELSAQPDMRTAVSRPDTGESYLSCPRSTLIRIKDVIDNLRAYHPAASVDVIEKAYVYSAKVHQGQVRLSGEPYLIHPLNVSYILTQMKLGEVSIATGLLHDAVEDTYATLEEIEALFGKEITTLVNGLTKLSKINFRSSEEREAENFRKMLLSMAEDIRVILIKLGDRLHNMRTLCFLPVEKQRIIAQETMDVYSPIASRLGMDWMKTELEDLSFRYLHPQEFAELERKIASKRAERDQYIKEVKAIITEKLGQVNLRDEVTGRLKHYYSIYKKMLNQQIDFDEVHDLIAFRIIVDSIRDCYAALGTIHSVWKPVPGRIKDFIAMPKANMYQSLHTTVIGPYGERMEIQIRTPEMHRIAEEGIAAHWRYKEGREINKRDDQLFSWLRQMLEWQQDLKDPAEFLETFRINLYPDEVYVFTPRGDVKAFPQGATPIDFAYGIHTDVGNKCSGARANGRMVPLTYQLRNGDTIEIITSHHQKPRKDWLKTVKTSRAKTKIRQYFRMEQRQEDIEAGREACQKELRKYGVDFARLLKSGEFDKLAKEYSFQDVQDLLAAVGYGHITVNQIVLKFVPVEKLEKQQRPLPHRQHQKKEGIGRTSSSGVQVKGLDNVLVNFAKCCNPLPGEDILGYITKGRGVTVHSMECARLLETDPERRVEVAWKSSDDVTRPAKIKVVCQDRPGLLAKVSGAISRQHANIRGAHIAPSDRHRSVSIFEVEVTNAEHLENIIRALSKIKGVSEVSRLRI